MLVSLRRPLHVYLHEQNQTIQIKGNSLTPDIVLIITITISKVKPYNMPAPICPNLLVGSEKSCISRIFHKLTN
jgi:hypothetical protein